MHLIIHYDAGGLVLVLMAVVEEHPTTSLVAVIPTEDQDMPVSKLGGFEFWRQTLKGAKLVVAPMVDQSALAWRMLSRRHGAQLCYTPMLHAKLFVETEAYRQREFTTCPEDRPLIVQFCGNDPDLVLAAAKLVEDRCDAVDLNLGCPQGIAKKGHYGSFLQDEWDLIASIVRKLHAELKIPVTCKIRIFPEVEKTIRYAKILEEAGCQLLTVHGRTRDQKAQVTGLADWDQIRQVREALSIPVFSNGNILYNSDVEKCLEYTGCQGVMTAEGNLYNPFIFEPELPLVTQVAREFKEMVERYNAIPSHVRAHFFKFLRPLLVVYPDFRPRLAAAAGLKGTLEVVEEVLLLAERDYEAAKAEDREREGLDLEEKQIPHWFCQPYFRPPPCEQHGKSTGTLNPLKRKSDSEELIDEPVAKETKVEA